MPATKKNLIRHGVRNVHYALLTINEEDNSYEYGEVKSLPGAVSLSTEASGETTWHYADDRAYAPLNNNAGYEGELEITMLPDEFLADVLGEVKDEKGVQYEHADAQASAFALLWQFTGDKRGIPHVLYNCVASRPSTEGETDAEEKTVGTDTISIKASALPDGKVKARVTDDAEDEIVKNWFTTVYVTQASEAV